MPAEIYEDSIDLETPTLRPLGFSASRSAYPLHCFELSPPAVVVTLRTVVLSNPYLRVVVCPDLGGRILGIHDRRTGIDVVPIPHSLKPVEGGPRGYWVPHGIQVMAAGPIRAHGEGPVEHLVREPRDLDSPAALFLHELVLGTALEWTACLTLPPDRAELTLELRPFDRGFTPGSGEFGWDLGAWPCLVRLAGGVAVSDPDTQAGLAVLSGDDTRPHVEQDPHDGRVRVWSRRSFLGPRETATYRLRLVPVTAMPQIDGAGRAGGLHVDRDQISVQVAEAVRGAKLLLQSAEGATFEAPFDADPGPPVRFPTGALAEPSAIELRDASRRPLLQWPTEPSIAAPPTEDTVGATFTAHAADPPPGSAVGQFYAALRDEDAFLPPGGFGLRHGIAWLRARDAVRKGAWAEADRHLEDAALALGDDVIVWWLRAAVARHAGQSDDERTDLVNAHLLSPLEPLLRAEAFLSTPVAEGREPSPLLRPLAHHPDALLEVADTLLDLRLAGDFVRLADEALRVHEVPLLRYLLAWSYLEHSRMEFEAAHQIQLAAAAPLEPPYPWRRYERLAVTTLRERFPADSRLAALAEFARP